MELPPGSMMTGIPHRIGTREYLACESGQVELVVSGETYQLSPGDVVVFRGDQKHSYANKGAKVAVAYSAVLLSPGRID
jgi:quercetin dioxygenase-like cupin family protein